MVNHAKLRGLMVERGLEVNRLASILGISRQAVSDKLSGKTSITLTDAQAISLALDMSNEERDAIFFADAVKSEATS
jgi:transcriptional regulator with XRE-family HTH domain